MKTFTKGLILLGIVMFSYIFIVTGAGTTLRGDTLSFDNPGVLNSLQNITLDNTPLIITDKNTSGLIAIFNAPLNFAPAVAQDASSGNSTFFFPNTSISFLGDVNNFDDINNQSRFSETNINNGTSASAGFKAINNLDFFVTFGIGSENFEFGGVPFNNEGAILNAGPGKFNFANINFAGWDFRSNVSGTFVESMQLSGGGNLNIAGNFTVNNTIAFTHVEEADNETGFVRMFCKSNNRCFIMRDDGVERRLLDGGGGSIIIDEEYTFTIEPLFQNGVNISSGQVVIEEFRGGYDGGQASVCVYNNGTLFVSGGTCIN